MLDVLTSEMFVMNIPSGGAASASPEMASEVVSWAYPTQKKIDINKSAIQSNALIKGFTNAPLSNVFFKLNILQKSLFVNKKKYT